MDAEKLWESWEKINRILRLKHHEVAKKYGLTLEQFHLLIELDELKLEMVSDEIIPPTIGEIAIDIGNAPHTLSEKIKRLEKKGLVKKVRDETDQRKNRVTFTEKGKNLINNIKKEVSETFIEKTNTMNDKNLKNLLKGLNELNEKLSNN